MLCAGRCGGSGCCKNRPFNILNLRGAIHRDDPGALGALAGDAASCAGSGCGAAPCRQLCRQVCGSSGSPAGSCAGRALQGGRQEGAVPARLRRGWWQERRSASGRARRGAAGAVSCQQLCRQECGRGVRQSGRRASSRCRLERQLHADRRAVACAVAQVRDGSLLRGEASAAAGSAWDQGGLRSSLRRAAAASRRLPAGRLRLPADCGQAVAGLRGWLPQLRQACRPKRRWRRRSRRRSARGRWRRAVPRAIRAGGRRVLEGGCGR